MRGFIISFFLIIIIFYYEKAELYLGERKQTGEEWRQTITGEEQEVKDEERDKKYKQDKKYKVIVWENITKLILFRNFVLYMKIKRKKH